MRLSTHLILQDSRDFPRERRHGKMTNSQVELNRAGGHRKLLYDPDLRFQRRQLLK